MTSCFKHNCLISGSVLSLPEKFNQFGFKSFESMFFNPPSSYSVYAEDLLWLCHCAGIFIKTR